MELSKSCFLLAMVFLIISPLEEIYVAMFWTSLMAWFLAFLFEN